MSVYARSGINTETFEFSLRREDENGVLVPLPIWVHNDGYFVEGIPGRRYTIDVRNCRPRTRVEFVVSVDGIDIHDGQDGDEKKSGLVIPGGSQWSFEGYRTSMNTVATFRFCAPDGSYAALTGRPKNIGVIGIAAYDEKEVLFRTPKPVSPWLLSRIPGYPRPRTWVEAAGNAGNTQDYSLNFDETSTPISSHDTVETTYRGSMEKGEIERGHYLSTNVSSQSIGTQYGEERSSMVTPTTFVRVSTSPNFRVSIRYETAEVLEKMGIPVHKAYYTAPEASPDPFPSGTHPFVPPPPSWEKYRENIF